jgi:hypothetical protein
VGQSVEDSYASESPAYRSYRGPVVDCQGENILYDLSKTVYKDLIQKQVGEWDENIYLIVATP